ncbi:MAG: DUF2934 domain-containing protein [Candidatus Zixiibacteriota bacterium]|nr:MAG: DUF2934 domain-containing protein [candidate division Zixibacteria bacterium]
MTKEIKRNAWSKFCRKFSSDNQFRWMKINMIDRTKNESRFAGDFPFIGLSLEKKGRLIDGLQLVAGWTDPDRVSRPILSIKDPATVMLEQEKDGTTTALKVMTRDGSEAMIHLMGARDPNWFVEKLAYSLYERRGYEHGNDMGDWFEAEKKVRQAETVFV